MTNERLRLSISKRIRGLLSGEYASYQLSTRGHDLEEKRRFRLGDDPRAIDFLAMAKRGSEEPRVVINRIEKGANLIFLIDCSASTRFGTVIEKYKYALDFVRQMTAACMGGGNRLRFIAFDERIRYASNFTMSVASADEALSDLSKLPVGRGITDLKKALTVLSAMVGRFSLNMPGLIFIISDFLIERDFRQQIARVGEQSDLVAVILRDPTELSLPRPRFGLIRLVDPETGQRFLARESANPLDKVAPILKRCGVDCLELNTGVEVGMSLKNLIKLFERKKEA